jgi:hypothetical protein
MPSFQFRFLPSDDSRFADHSADFPDEIVARQAAFSTIRTHLADELLSRGQIDLRRQVNVLDSGGLELFRIDFAHAIGVVR